MVVKKSKPKNQIRVEDLDLPKLNTSKNPQTKIQKKGKKKGKIFAETKDDLQNILNQVTYELDDKIKSKLQVAHEREAVFSKQSDKKISNNKADKKTGRKNEKK
ncbi:hypothetical protein POMI540_0334 [Schizosaccharomyces pombe]